MEAAPNGAKIEAGTIVQQGPAPHEPALAGGPGRLTAAPEQPPDEAVVLVVDGYSFRRVRAATAALPPHAGTYGLVLVLDAPARLSVGRLGVVSLAPGSYAYCGSALGPGGLRARVGRHLRGAARRHWHVDALLACARVAEVWVCQSHERLECRLAACLAALPDAQRAAPGFGASDCRCASHLVRLPAPGRTPGPLPSSAGEGEQGREPVVPAGLPCCWRGRRGEPLPSG
jgi:Uri superfamily endonuclease